MNPLLNHGGKGLIGLVWISIVPSGGTLWWYSVVVPSGKTTIFHSEIICKGAKGAISMAMLDCQRVAIPK